MGGEESVPHEALTEAIEAGKRRDERADQLLTTFRKGYKLIGVALGVLAIGLLVLAAVVVWNWRASDARAVKFETVLVCDSNSQRDVAVDVGKAKAGEDNQFLVPVSCGVPK